MDCHTILVVPRGENPLTLSLMETICASMVVGRKIRCTWGYCWRIIILRLQKVNATYLNKNLV